MKHHAFLGTYDFDADIPSHWEQKLFGRSAIGKALWMFFFSIMQALRPVRLRVLKPIDRWVVINVVAQVIYDAALLYFWGPKAMAYMFISLMFSVGLHPLGARWIQEHYIVFPGQETADYYGPLNPLALNVGFHNEHHDFPSIPWNRLPEVKRAAPEAYDTLHYHPSWSKLLWRFIVDPRHFALHALRPSGALERLEARGGEGRVSGARRAHGRPEPPAAPGHAAVRVAPPRGPRRACGFSSFRKARHAPDRHGAVRPRGKGLRHQLRLDQERVVVGRRAVDALAVRAAVVEDDLQAVAPKIVRARRGDDRDVVLRGVPVVVDDRVAPGEVELAGNDHVAGLAVPAVGVEADAARVARGLTDVTLGLRREAAST